MYICMLLPWNQMTTLHEVLWSDALYLKRVRATLIIQFGILTMLPRHLVMLCSAWTLKAEDEIVFSSVHTARARTTGTLSLCYRLCTGYSFCDLKYPNYNALSRGCLWSTASAPSRWSPGLRWSALLGLGLVKPSTSMEMASRRTSLWPITSTLDASLQKKKLVKTAVRSTHNYCLLWIIRNTFVYTFTVRGT